jgi:tetratricopeptide (TPR) repeat protein
MKTLLPIKKNILKFAPLVFKNSNTLYLAILIKVIIIFLFFILYLGYPFPVENESNNNLSVIKLNLTENSNLSESLWEKIWKDCETLKPNEYIISQLTDKLHQDSQQKLISLLKKGLMPMADTFFMRRPHSLPAIDSDIIRKFQAINLLNDSNKIYQLEIIAKNTDSTIRYRALLELARSIFRKGTNSENFDNIIKILNAAKEIDTPYEAWKSDIYFLLGNYYIFKEEYIKGEQALKKAITLDPFFIDARWAMIELLLNKISKNDSIYKSSIYLETSATIIEHIEKIALYAQDRGLFIDIALELDKLTYYSAVKNIAIGYSLYLGGDNKKARLKLDAVQKYSSKLPRHCKKELNEKAEWLIKKMEDK